MSGWGPLCFTVSATAAPQAGPASCGLNTGGGRPVPPRGCPSLLRCRGLYAAKGTHQRARRPLRLRGCSLRTRARGAAAARDRVPVVPVGARTPPPPESVTRRSSLCFFPGRAWRGLAPPARRERFRRSSHSRGVHALVQPSQVIGKCGDLRAAPLGQRRGEPCHQPERRNTRSSIHHRLHTPPVGAWRKDIAMTDTFDLDTDLQRAAEWIDTGACGWHGRSRHRSHLMGGLLRR